jgi:ribonuclease HI
MVERSCRFHKDRSGCAVIYMPESDDSATRPECIGFRIEEHGPDRAFYQPDSRRACLRAVVAALEFKLWSSEGWERVTIATDGGFVVDNITRHIARWAEQGWLGGEVRPGRKVLNLDLWARLLDLINEQAYHGCEVIFWHIKARENQQEHAL